MVPLWADVNLTLCEKELWMVVALLTGSFFCPSVFISAKLIHGEPSGALSRRAAKSAGRFSHTQWPACVNVA